ncbi:MAG TPA: response regulator transcription factor [Streptosporangiaceae bacterium]|nr:response regulator transcription factor [Streptosporangiaceae bacterium]
MRLVLCDENRILCEALAAGLKARGHQVVGIATTAPDGVRAVAAHQPDICLLDLRFHGSPDGLAAARTIRKRHPGTKVLVLSAVTEPAIVAGALEGGVAGFLRKDQDVGQIAAALDVIAEGGLVIDEMPRWARNRTAAIPREQSLRALTPRETEVLQRIVAGQDTAQMVREMEIATSTLQTYVKNVLAKLGAHSRLEAAALASRTDLLGAPDVPPAAPSAEPGPRPAAKWWSPPSGVGEPTAGWGFATEE